MKCKESALMVSNFIYSHHGIHIKEGMADLKWKYFNNIDHQSLTNCKLESFIDPTPHKRLYDDWLELDYRSRLELDLTSRRPLETQGIYLATKYKSNWKWLNQANNNNISR